MDPPPVGFLLFQYFEKILPLVESLCLRDVLYRGRYVLWVVVLLGAYDVTKYCGSQDLGTYPPKTADIANSLVLDMKEYGIINTLLFFVNICAFSAKKVKNMIFLNSKIA